jgi:hypothetical protein
MIITKLHGGLGNQMFQYATGRRLAEKYHTDLRLDISEYSSQNQRQYQLDKFYIKANIATENDIRQFKNVKNYLFDKIRPLKKQRVVNYSSYGYDKRITKLGANIYLNGYWQSEKYFSDISDIIKQEFTLQIPLEKKYPDLIKSVSLNNSISLHIRRGDYLNKKLSQIYNILPKDYYQKALDIITPKIATPVLYIFSDDIFWVQKNLTFHYPVHYIEQNTKLADYEELILMSKCRHNIIANSSFSWWSAWLNANPEKIVIAPKDWFVSNRYFNSEIYPKDWVVI